ncbi:6,7-dimethyl-8-ribityllumazine synthase [endosymbiont of Acanthamoeba sp. UWC8]|uniref:6,7-dimethyl-8-ribityllumazine synthase n=1 Tax=endosymbiont of Acanthamoeba sp. UWC8 TaxID=86106 RepID=UPI0004D0EAFB|nr:6,7-dimethyl-8-ribityllumazine synthase [endosymbiont of Acanthamoeba sp. UWC8]AIF80670.1 6,7-dimethyl-8-ribityllumazine synthase [endosymbiont of Acanthamoeba sp. UWC8]
MKDYRIAIVQSRFNAEITDSLSSACIEKLKQYGVYENNISLFYVPGAVELPLASKLLAKKKDVDAIVCIGAVIKGDTDHYQYVCEQVNYGCQKVALEQEIPIIFGVLTVPTYELALARAGDDLSLNKGAECADAAVEMLKFIRIIKAA